MAKTPSGAIERFTRCPQTKRHDESRLEPGTQGFSQALPQAREQIQIQTEQIQTEGRSTGTGLPEVSGGKAMAKARRARAKEAGKASGREPRRSVQGAVYR